MLGDLVLDVNGAAQLLGGNIVRGRGLELDVSIIIGLGGGVNFDYAMV